MLNPPLGRPHSGHLGGACTLAEYLKHRCTLSDFPKVEGNLTPPQTKYAVEKINSALGISCCNRLSTVQNLAALQV